MMTTIWMVIVVLFVAFVGTLGWAIVERSLRLSMVQQYERRIEAEQSAWAEAFERVINVQTIGTPTPAEVRTETVPDAEERALRAVSEATIQKGMQQLRAIYDAQHMPVEEEVLRAEAISMLNGLDVVPPVPVLTRR